MNDKFQKFLLKLKQSGPNASWYWLEMFPTLVIKRDRVLNCFGPSKMPCTMMTGLYPSMQTHVSSTSSSDAGDPRVGFISTRTRVSPVDEWGREGAERLGGVRRDQPIDLCPLLTRLGAAARFLLDHSHGWVRFFFFKTWDRVYIKITSVFNIWFACLWCWAFHPTKQQ